MTNPHHPAITRAIFYIATARDKLSEIKEAVKAEAQPTDYEEQADNIAAAIERALLADAIFKALAGFDLIEERLKAALKVHGAIEARGYGPLIGVGIKKSSGLTLEELTDMLPREAVSDPITALLQMLANPSDGSTACQCPKCQAKRSEG